MKRHNIVIVAAAGLVAVAGLAVAAGTEPEQDVRSIAAAKVPLSQAVLAAEAHVQGRATRAEFEASRTPWTYEVEVVNGAKVFDVKVDAGSGAVLSATEDRADREGDSDEEREGD